MKKIFQVFVLMALVTGMAAAQVDPIGRIKDVEGTAHITQNGRRSEAKVGAAVYLKDNVGFGGRRRPQEFPWTDPELESAPDVFHYLKG